MKKMIKFILWTILILLFAGFIGGYIFIKTFDLNKYKTHVQNLVYQQTGRKLELNGDAGIKISLIPTIVLNDVALSNASWAKEPQMLKAEKVEATFSILPLLHKEIVIDSIALNEPQVYLSVNKNGEGNWVFAKPEAKAQVSSAYCTKEFFGNILISSAHAAENVQKIDEVGGVPVSIVAKSMQVNNGLVVYKDLGNGAEHKLNISSLSMSSAGMDDDINLDFDLVYNGEKIQGTAVAGSMNALLQKASQYPIKANVKAFGVTVEADTVLKDMAKNLQFSGKVKAQNPSGNFGAPAVNLDAAFNGSVKNISAVINSLNIAGNIVTGKIKADLQKAKPYVTTNLQSGQFDLQKLTAVAQRQVASGLSLIPQASAAAFVPNSPLDLKFLNALNAKAEVSVSKLIVSNMVQADNVKLVADLNNGVLNLNPLQLNIAGGVVNGTITANANSNALSADLNGKDVVLQKLWKGFSVSDTSSFGISSGGKTDFNVNVRGSGSTVRQIVENLSGQIVAVTGASKIQTGSLKYLSGNFISQLLKFLNIERREKNMDLTCAVIRADITNGNVVFPKGIVFNAKQMTVVSDGSVNLKNDRLNLSIHPFNGKIADTNVAQAISSLVKISGTIEKPTIGLDNSAVIKNVVGVAAAGPAFLGSQLLLDVDESPCYTALKGTSYQNMFPAPTGAKAVGQGVYQGTSDAVSAGVNAITDTAKGVINIFTGKK